MMGSCRSTGMDGFLKVLIVVVASSSWMFAEKHPTVTPKITSTWADSDPALDSNPSSQFWRGAQRLYMDRDPHGRRVPKYRTDERHLSRPGAVWPIRVDKEGAMKRSGFRTRAVSKPDP